MLERFKRNPTLFLERHCQHAGRMGTKYFHMMRRVTRKKLNPIFDQLMRSSGFTDPDHLSIGLTLEVVVRIIAIHNNIGYEEAIEEWKWATELVYYQEKLGLTFTLTAFEYARFIYRSVPSISKKRKAEFIDLSN